MSDRNQGISPFKDPAFLKGSDKTRRANVSADDINEFRKTFSDDEEVKRHTPAAAKRPKAVQTAPASAKKEDDLYAVQQVDIDAIMRNISGTAVKKEGVASQSSAASRKKTEAPEGRTRSFSLNSSAKKRINEAARASGEEKNIKKNVRVLVKNKQSDRHILDTARDDGEEKTNIIDVLSSVKNDNIFDAVDKGVTKGGNNSIVAEAMEARNRNERKKRDHEAILTGKALRGSLIKANNSRKTRLAFVLALFFLSLVLSLLPLFYSEGNLLEFMFGNGGLVYSIINIVLLTLLVAVFFKNYLNAIKSIRTLKLNGDFSLLVITVFVLLHDISVLFLGTAGAAETKFYTCFAVFAAGTVCITDYFNTRTALGSLTTVMKNKNLRSVQPVPDRKDAASLAKGITDSEDPLLLYSTDVEMGDSLTAEVGPRHNESRFYTYSLLAVILVAFVLYISSLIISRDATASLGILLSTICLCSPLTGRAAAALLNYISNRRLNREGAAATHNEGIHLIGNAHGITMDVSDIFTADVSGFRLAPGVLMKQNDAAIIAAAVLINAGTLPGKSFRDFISQIGAALPVTENVQYEEKLGFSAWVSGKRVLVGSREMLIQHSLPVPDEREEKLYAGNKFVMYLVIEGRVSASFLVNYRTLASVKQFSADFNKTGLVLLLTCKEPGLDYKEIAKRLYLESAAVRILSGKNEGIIEAYRKERITDLNGGLVCAKAGRGLLSLVINAYNLYNKDRFLFNLHLSGQIIAVCLIILSYILNLSLFASPAIIIIFKLIWSFCAYMITTGKSQKIK